MRHCLTLIAVVFGLSLAPAVAGESWPGVFEPRAQAVIPSEVAMPVVSLPVKPGESCAAGDVLVEFDATIAQAALDAAEARVDAAEVNYEGQESLFDRQQATEVELARAASELGQARLAAVTARRELDACRVAAPFAGRIVEHRVREYEWAGKGAPLLLLVDDSVLKARFFLPEENFPDIAVGDAVTAVAPSTGLSAPGTVSRLGVVFDPASRTFDVWADVDNADGLLRAGMTAEVIWPPEGTPASKGTRE